MCDSPRTGCARRRTPYIYVVRTSNNSVIMACELYCCLLPQCEALRICRSGFPIATVLGIIYTRTNTKLHTTVNTEKPPRMMSKQCMSVILYKWMIWHLLDISC